MKIQYCSDLHLEFQENKKYLKQFPIVPTGDILLLAGDIVPFAIMDKHKDFFNYVSDHFETTFWIPGNHEYYNFDASDKCGTLNEKIRSNVFLVNNKVILYNDVPLIFSTLWSKINPEKQWYIERTVNDFQVIKYNSFRFSIDRFNEMHEECLKFLNQAQQQNNNSKKVVVTHHVPTFLNYPEQYRNSDINEAFAVEMHDFIESSNLSHWIYGHHHCNIPGFKIGSTTMLTNQLGYVQDNENELFNTSAIIEI